MFVTSWPLCWSIYKIQNWKISDLRFFFLYSQQPDLRHKCFWMQEARVCNSIISVSFSNISKLLYWFINCLVYTLLTVHITFPSYVDSARNVSNLYIFYHNELNIGCFTRIKCTIGYVFLYKCCKTWLVCLPFFLNVWICTDFVL